MSACSTFDVEIVGAGIFGLSIAFECTRRGASVYVSDRGPPESSASFGLLGALTPHAPDAWNARKQFQLESLLMSRCWWQEVEEKGGKPSGYARTGRLLPVVSKRGLVAARRRQHAATVNWRGHALWTVKPAAEFAESWRPVSPSGWVVSDTLSARIMPRQAMHALLAALQEMGGQFGTSRLNGGSSGATVFATGVAGLAQLGRQFGCTLGMPEKGQAMLLELADAGTQLLCGDRLYIVPHADGRVAVGSTSEREFSDARQTDGMLDELRDRAVQLFPRLKEGRIVHRWAHARPRCITRAPILGADPMRPGTFIANGGYKTGFGMAPRIASVMADLVLEGLDTVPSEMSLEHALGLARQ